MTDQLPLAAEVDTEIFAAYPDYVAAILVAEGIGNGPSDADSDRLLEDAEGHVRARGLERAADAPQLACWRAAFSSFGAKPSRYQSSAEALAARVLKGGSLPRVNQLVDLYNAVSVRHLVPVAARTSTSCAGRCGSRSPTAASASTLRTASSTRGRARSSGATTSASPAAAGTGGKACGRG